MRSQYQYASESAAIHIYQRSYNGYVVFYSVKDHLIFFMTLCLMARKFGVSILGICIMPDHFHMLIRPVPLSKLSSFMKESTRYFARVYNAWYGRQGQLFSHPYGKSIKKGDKKIRTAAAYVYNNPVEKRLSSRAELYQWNFLSYANRQYPFSEKLPLRKTRKALRRALSVIPFYFNSGKIIPYMMMENLSSDLTPDEVKVWVDSIVQTYNCIDYKDLLSFYESLDLMLLAFKSNTGSEYDINEDYTPGSVRVYATLTNFLYKVFKITDIREVLSMPQEKRIVIGNTLLLRTKASRRQIKKYLHLDD